MTEQTTANSRPYKLALDSVLSLIGRGGGLVSSSAILFLVAFSRGPAEAGVYALATKYTALVLGFAVLGLDSLLIRDVSQHPKQARNYVVNLSVLRLLVAILAYGALTLFVSTVPDYAPHTTNVVILFGLSIIPESLYRLYQSTLVTLDGYNTVARLGFLRAAVALPLGIGALLVGASLEIVVLLQVGVAWLVLLLTLVPLRARLRSASAATGMDNVQRLTWDRAKSWLQATLPFAVIDGLFTLEWQLDVVLLSFFVNEQQVGLYGVAQGILSILMLLLYSADAVIFPLISRTVVQGRADAKKVLKRLVAVIAAGVIPFAIALAIFLGLAIPRVLGDEFIPVLAPLYWLIIAWVVHFLNAPGARLIISVGWQRFVAALVALSVLLNTVLSLLLIPSLGIQGPAVARTASAAVYALACTAIVFWLFTRAIERWKTA